MTPVPPERDEAAFLREVVDAVREPLLVLGPDLRVRWANRAFHRAFRVDPEETEGRPFHELGDGRWDLPALRRLLEEAPPADRPSDDLEVTHDFGRAGSRTLLLNARRVGAARFVLLAIEDVTERRRAETRQRLLVREMGHRMKNALAVVQSLAAQTAAGCRSLEEFVVVFGGRLRALAGVHDLLLAAWWRGADLGALVRRTLEPYALGSPGRVEAEGAPVLLPARQGLSLALALHELATNAAKYGALSVPGGTVAVGWTVGPGDGGARRVRLRWREAGGPEVAPPRRGGFGTRLIEQTLAFDLGGGADLRFVPGGLECELAFPLP